LSSEIKKTWLCVDLPLTDYQTALNFQHQLAEARKNKTIPNVILFLEHPPVYTLGRGRRHLPASGIPMVQTERGGNITYHGPGQLVVYPILNLQKAHLRVAEYVEKLEETMIRIAADFGVTAERNPLNRGIWVKQRKLGSIGIAIRRSIAFHGFALNVNLSLKPFDRINPCGLCGIKMTSLERERCKSVSVDQVRESAKHHIETVFDIRLETTLPEWLNLKNGNFTNTQTPMASQKTSAHACLW
jgi:lipoate-protein ligase B